MNSRLNEKHKEINKILVRNSVTFYSEAWKKRNEVMHDLEKYKSFVCNWYKNVKDMIVRENRPKMK